MIVIIIIINNIIHNIIIVGFPPVVSAFSNWGGHLRCSHEHLRAQLHILVWETTVPTAPEGHEVTCRHHFTHIGVGDDCPDGTGVPRSDLSTSFYEVSGAPFSGDRGVSVHLRNMHSECFTRNVCQCSLARAG